MKDMHTSALKILVGLIGGWLLVGTANAVDSDCLPIDPDRVEMERYGDGYRLVQGRRAIKVLGSSRREASQVLQTIRHYGMNQMCYIGRPDPSFEYMLVDDAPPTGEFDGEDCNRFDPDNVRARRIDGSWRVVDGNHYLFDFGSNRSEARQAVRTIRHHDFNHSCFIGRPGPVFTYLRSDKSETAASPRRLPHIGSMADRIPQSSGTIAEAIRPPEQDCVSFDPDNARAHQVDGRWKVTDGGHYLLDFGSEGRQARHAVTFIRHYGMDESCYVSRPNPPMRYFLVDGKSPNGSHRLEDCAAFDNDQVEADRVRGKWRVVSGDRWLINFENDRAGAEKAAKIIRYYGFTRQCFVGRPDPGMAYFRR